MFTKGFRKTAALKDVWKDRLRGLLTGKRTLYHGTSRAAERRILKSGIEPRGKGGVTGGWENAISGKAPHIPGLKNKNKGHSFLTEDPDIAREYAYRANKTRRNYMEDKHRTLGKKLFNSEGGVTKALSNNKSVVQVEVPKKWLKNNKVINPEVKEQLRHKTSDGIFRKIVDRLRGDFRHGVTIRGTVPAEFIKRSK